MCCEKSKTVLLSAAIGRTSYTTVQEHSSFLSMGRGYLTKGPQHQSVEIKNFVMNFTNIYFKMYSDRETFFKNLEKYSVKANKE